MAPTPSIPVLRSRVEFVPAKTVGVPNVLLYGGRGTGTAVADTLYLINDRASGLALFATGFMSEAIREWYAQAPVANLYAFGVAEAGWAVNTYTLTVALVAPALAAESTTLLVLRAGETVIPIQVNLGDSLAVIQGKAVAAINASSAPLAAVAGAPGEVDITHVFAGESYNRWPVSVQHFEQRDEPFPQGITASVNNEETGVGAPTTFAVLPSDAPDFYLILSDTFTTGLYLTDLNDSVLALWANNRYPLAVMQFHGTDLGEMTTLFDARNDGKIVVRSSLNSPTPAAVSLARFAARVANRATEQPNRSFIGKELEMVAPTITLDAQSVQNVGLSPITFVGTTTTIVTTNTLRRQNNAAEADFSQFKFGKVMTAAQVAREMLIASIPFLGKIKVPDDQVISVVAKDDIAKPKFVRVAIRNVIIQAASRAWLQLEDPSILDTPGAIQIEDLVELSEDVGWEVRVSGIIAREIAVFDILFQAF